MPDCGIGLMAKYPTLGNVKTRLESEIGDRAALTVYRKLLDNIVSVLTSLPAQKYYRSAFIDPPEEKNKFATEYGNFDNYKPQSGNDLGARMLNAIKELLTVEQINKAILMGVDIPEIDTTIIEQANEILETKDLVVGPTNDGGYYLIGMKKPVCELFNNIEWSTSSVFNGTISIAEDMNLDIAVLSRLSDLDNLNDLKRFEHYYSVINL